MRVLLILLLLGVSLTACATIPTGPSVMALPGTGKSFEQFRIDDALCRQFAYEQVGGVTTRQAAQNAAVSSAIIGTALGAAAGAAIGSASGEAGAGAAIGAGSGLIIGSAAGTSYATGSYYEAQQRYDYAYLQCMYAKGNRIPVYGGYASQPSSAPPRRVSPPPPPPSYPLPTAPPE
jgi:hypothetical protein